jgi:hypothetical protein
LILGHRAGFGGMRQDVGLNQTRVTIDGNSLGGQFLASRNGRPPWPARSEK